MGLIASYRKSDAELRRLEKMARHRGTRVQSEEITAQKRARQLRTDEVAVAADRYRAGTSITALAHEYGVHRSTMSERLRAAGVKIRNEGMTPELIERAAELYRSGLSLAGVGDRLGFNNNTILTHLRRAGVEIRRRKGGVRKLQDRD